jgi:choline dehydrogenase-like flavoprotein
VAVQFDRFKMSYLVYARREIILSGGTINSPQLLMLSGIGPAHHLSSLGVIQFVLLSFAIKSTSNTFSADPNRRTTAEQSSQSSRIKPKRSVI